MSDLFRNDIHKKTETKLYDTVIKTKLQTNENK